MRKTLRSFCCGVALAGFSITGGAIWAAASPAPSAANADSPAMADGEAAGWTLPTHETEADNSPHTPDTDDRLSKSEVHFNSGRQFYFRGDVEAARREFDAAVDTLLNASENAPDHSRIE